MDRKLEIAFRELGEIERRIPRYSSLSRDNTLFLDFDKKEDKPVLLLIDSENPGSFGEK